MASRPFDHTTHPEPAMIVVTETHINAALLLVGRLLFGGYFVYASSHHFLERASLAGFAAERGVPFPELAVLATGTLLLLGGLSIVTGVVPKFGAFLIGLFLVGVTPIMHAFWNDPTPAARAADIVNFTKNLALLGATCVIAALPEPWPASPHRQEIEL